MRGGCRDEITPSLDQQPGLHGWARRVLSGQLAWSGSPSQPCPWVGVSADLGDSRRKVKARSGRLRTLVLGDHA